MAKDEQGKELNAEEIGKMSFEKAIDSLTEIVEDIEAGQVDLESSLTKYESGMAMIKHCRKILEDAEKRIKKVSESKN